MNDVSRKHVVDWQRLHENLRAAEQAFAEGGQLSPDREAELLRMRARQLAATRSEGTIQNGLEVVRFSLGKEHYALSLDAVQGAHQLREFAALPGLPPEILGVFNIRGRLVSIIDLRQLFQLPSKGLFNFNLVLVVSDGARELGLVVDEIVGLEKVDTDRLSLPPSNIGDRRTEYMLGLTADTAIVLRPEHLLQDPRLVVNFRS